MLIETATGHQIAFNLKQSLSEFAEWTLQMPAGITRNRTDVHEWMIRVLNTCEEKSMDASTVAILLQLWGFPGDDVPYELNSIAVDISYNFNRLNQQLWAPPAFEKAEQNSIGEVEQERIVTEQSVPVNEQKTEGITYVPYREGLTPDDLFGVTPDISF